MMGFRTSPRLVQAGLIGGAATASGVALTSISGWLIVQASTRPVILTLLAAIVAVRAFGIARPVLRYAERLVSHNAALTALAERRVETYAALVPLTPARLGAHARSDVLTGVVRDLDDEVDAQVRVVVPIFGALTAAAMAIVAATLLLPQAGLVVAAVIASMVFAGVATYRRERHIQTRGLLARADANRVATLVTSHALDLQAVSATSDAQEWLRRAHREVRCAAQRQGRLRAIALLWQHATTLGSTLVMAVIVAPEVGRTITAPVSALLVLVPVALADASGTIPDSISAWARATAARDRLRAFLSQEEPAVATTPGQPTPDWTVDGIPRIELSAVRARWTSARDVLPAMSLVVDPGSRLVVTGPIGSGKSTLLAVIARHLDPVSGDYRLGGVDALKASLEDVRSTFAIVDDEPHLFASSLRENLRLARPGAPDDALIEALNVAGLSDWFAALPDGLDALLGSVGRGVSGGERTRVALARAVLSGRSVLLLDEPVAHLDHATSVAVFRDVSRAAEGRSVVVVSHHTDALTGFGRPIEVGDLRVDAGANR